MLEDKYIRLLGDRGRGMKGGANVIPVKMSMKVNDRIGDLFLQRLRICINKRKILCQIHGERA